MPMTYQGTLNVDFTNHNGNEYERLKNALIQAGWRWVETSAFLIDSPTLGAIWRGIDLAARQSADIGQLSALTYHIQGIDNAAGNIPASAPNQVQAQNNIMQKPFPTP